MNLLDQFTVGRRRGAESAATVELLSGDLSAIPREHAVDALVVSAFPNSYTPDRGTLFQALFHRGLDMRAVAGNKEEDQRENLGCWISRPLPAELSQTFNFTRIVCFEPSHPSFLRRTGVENITVEQTVGYVFRCLNNFIIPDPTDTHGARHFHIKRVAMPLLATGNQGVPIELMLPELLKAAVFWLEEGLPIERLQIVAFSPNDIRVAAPIFSSFSRNISSAPAMPETASWPAELAQTITAQMIAKCVDHLRTELLILAEEQERPMVEKLFARLAIAQMQLGSQAPAAVARSTKPEYDIFISYSHKQEQEVFEFVSELRQQYPALEVFYDRNAIQAGAGWLKLISDAVQQARVFIAILSPDYSASPVCWDEFQCAKLKEYNTKASIIRTIRLYSENQLPPIMALHSYIDCVEGDLLKFRQSISNLSIA